jgi:hypothetical protein
MPLRMIFTAPEREKLGVLINNISIYGSQLVTRGGSEILMRALTNIANLQKEPEDLLKRLHELAQEQNEESPLRLIEDLRRVPVDVATMLTLVRRCLLASAFLGHLLAQPTHPQATAEGLAKTRQLH